MNSKKRFRIISKGISRMMKEGSAEGSQEVWGIGATANPLSSSPQEGKPHLLICKGEKEKEKQEKGKEKRERRRTRRKERKKKKKKRMHKENG